MTEQSGDLAIVAGTASQTPSAGTNSAGTDGGRFRYMNGHLPPALQQDRKWTKQILPALLRWAGSLGDPWVIPDQDLVRTLRIIVTSVDPHFDSLDEIRPGMPIFVLVITIFFSLIECWTHALLNRQLGGSVCGEATSVPPLLLSWLTSLLQMVMTQSLLLLYRRHVLTSWMGLRSCTKILILRQQRMPIDRVFSCSSLLMPICALALGALTSQGSTLMI